MRLPGYDVRVRLCVEPSLSGQIIPQTYVYVDVISKANFPPWGFGTERASLSELDRANGGENNPFNDVRGFQRMRAREHFFFQERRPSAIPSFPQGLTCNYYRH